MRKRNLLKRYLLTLLLISLFCLFGCESTKDTVVISPQYPDLKAVEEILGGELYSSAHTKLDLIASPQTVNDLLYNLSEYRTGYINWRTYATALENYYEKVRVIVSNTETTKENKEK